MVVQYACAAHFSPYSIGLTSWFRFNQEAFFVCPSKHVLSLCACTIFMFLFLSPNEAIRFFFFPLKNLFFLRPFTYVPPPLEDYKENMCVDALFTLIAVGSSG